RNHIKLAFRSLRKNSLFTFINILGLTIGMAATIMIYVWVQNEWSFDAYYEKSDRLNRVFCHWNGGGERIYIDAIPIMMRDQAEESLPEIEQFHLLRPNFRRPYISTPQGNRIEERRQAYVTENWFETFDYELVAGSIDAFEQDKYSVALTRDAAKKYFGSQEAVGQVLTMDSTNYTVQAVFENLPANSSFYYEVYLPLDAYWKDQKAYEEDYRSGNFNYIAFAETDKNIDRERLAEQLAMILNEGEEEETNGCSVVPIGEMRFNKELKGDYFDHQNKATVYIFAIIGFIMLLIAGLNYVNLSTALMSKNVQDIGVKKVIGANFRHIFAQVMSETTLISFLAFGLALLLVKLTLPSLSNFMETDFYLNLSNPSIWLIFGGVLLLSILIAGVYPALMSAGAKPIQLLHSKSTQSEGMNMRNVLVTVQFAASIMVLISTLAIYQQLQYVQQKDVGYNREKVVYINPRLWQGPGSLKNFVKFIAYKKELEKLAGFKAAVLTDASLTTLNNQNSGGLDWEGKPENLSPNVHQLRVNEDYLDVFDLKMQDGRWFSDARKSDTSNIILNESAVKTFGIPQPVVGRRAKYHGGEGRIIGVVKDFNFRSLHQEVTPLVIWSAEGRGNKIMARIQSDDPQEVMAKAKVLFQEFLPNIEFEYSFIEDDFLAMHEADRKLSTLFQIFAALLIFVSCLGLLGLAVFAAERRVKEIGVRKVLGASVANIVALLSKDFLKLLLIALVIASPIAYYFMQNWLNNFAYHIELQWWFFALAGFAAVAVALFTVSLQSIRAASVNPVESLRNE
ncbi:MAG: ABC transporter permease, partial [Bacteroidota bacterium]